MIVQIVKFETSMTEDELLAVADSRLAQYLATPGLVEKFYCKFAEPYTYGGVLVWDSMASLKAFGETDLAKTITEAYKVVGQPKVEVLDSMFELRNVMSKAA